MICTKHSRLTMKPAPAAGPRRTAPTTLALAAGLSLFLTCLAQAVELSPGPSPAPLSAEVERRNFPLERDRNFMPRRPRIVMPSTVGPRTYGSPAMLPKGSAWYAYCREKHPSFDPRTGFYTAYSGRKMRCR